MIHCLHGAVGSFQAWEPFRKSFGEPSNPIDLWRFFDHSAPTLVEAGRLICQLAEQNDMLLGYSMGGRLALHALLAEPQKWKAAIIISSHPGLLVGQSDRQSQDRDWAELAEKEWPAFLHQWNQQGIFSALPKGLNQAGIEDQQQVSQSFLQWSLGIQKNLRVELPKITCPILWVTGENDPKFTKLAEESTTLLPNSKHQVISNSGHRVPWDQPNEFCEVIQTFLQSVRSH